MESKLGGAFRTLAAGACALAIAVGLGGCSLGVPSLSEAEVPAKSASVSAPDIHEEGVLTVGMDTADAPQVINGQDGYTGYYVDVASALAERLGLDLRIVSAASATTAFDKTDADVFIGSDASDAPDGCRVIGSVLENAPAVFAKHGQGGDAADVAASDLSGETVVVQDSSASQDALSRAGIEANFKTEGNVNDCFDDVASGQANYIACDATAGGYLSRAFSDVALAGTLAAPTSYGLAVPSKSGIADAVSDALDELESEGVLEALHGRWYGGVPLSLSDAGLSGVTLSAASSEDSGSKAADGADASAKGESADESMDRELNSLG